MENDWNDDEMDQGSNFTYGLFLGGLDEDPYAEALLRSSNGYLENLSSPLENHDGSPVSITSSDGTDISGPLEPISDEDIDRACGGLGQTNQCQWSQATTSGSSSSTTTTGSLSSATRSGSSSSATRSGSSSSTTMSGSLSSAKTTGTGSSLDLNWVSNMDESVTSSTDGDLIYRLFVPNDQQPAATTTTVECYSSAAGSVSTNNHMVPSNMTSTTYQVQSTILGTDSAHSAQLSNQNQNQNSFGPQCMYGQPSTSAESSRLLTISAAALQQVGIGSGSRGLLESQETPTNQPQQPGASSWNMTESHRVPSFPPRGTTRDMTDSHLAPSCPPIAPEPMSCTYTRTPPPTSNSDGYPSNAADFYYRVQPSDDPNQHYQFRIVDPLVSQTSEPPPPFSIASRPMPNVVQPILRLRTDYIQLHSNPHQFFQLQPQSQPPQQQPQPQPHNPQRQPQNPQPQPQNSQSQPHQPQRQPLQSQRQPHQPQRQPHQPIPGTSTSFYGGQTRPQPTPGTSASLYGRQPQPEPTPGTSASFYGKQPQRQAEPTPGTSASFYGGGNQTQKKNATMISEPRVTSTSNSNDWSLCTPSTSRGPGRPTKNTNRPKKQPQPKKAPKPKRPRSSAENPRPRSGNGSNRRGGNRPPSQRPTHQCPTCKRDGFRDNTGVTVHMRTHTKEKPFECEFCGRCFAQKAHLHKHYKVHGLMMENGELVEFKPKGKEQLEGKEEQPKKEEEQPKEEEEPEEEEEQPEDKQPEYKRERKDKDPDPDPDADFDLDLFCSTFTFK